MAKITKINKEVLFDIKHFFNKINEKALYNLGYSDSYDDNGEPALASSVEYFHPQITLDDRMQYIAKNIVMSDLSPQNIICNTIISHFYGARGIHQTITRDPNPKTALVDFERLTQDSDYRELLASNLSDAKSLGIPLYGSTELRTSLFGAANKYVSEKFNVERNSNPENILLWVAGFIERGIIDKMYDATSLKELFNVLTKLEGVGSYYGYHCSTSNSVNPDIMVNHDERFCVPGPGARMTLDMLFGSDCKVNHGDRVVWFRENYKKLIGDIYLHPDTHNIEVDGFKIFEDEQDELKTYGCEVGLCQYGVYHRFKSNPHLINRRKVARIDENMMKEYFGSEPSPQKAIPKKKAEPKKKKDKPTFKVNCDNGVQIIQDVIDQLGSNKFTHNAIAKIIDSKGGLGLKQDGNWKESWTIMQAMVEEGLLIKESRSYIKNY